MSRLGTLGARLYRGEVSIDFVGRRKTWYLISAAIVLVAIAGLVVRGLNYGIEFKGGVEYNAQFRAGTDLSAKVDPISRAVVSTNIENAANPVVVVSGTRAIRIDVKPLTLGQKQEVGRAIKQASGSTEINSTVIGPTWGASIAKKALTGLIVFIVLVVLFIWGYFREWRMSVAGMVALAHDLVITVGVYALTGFEVTPATVTGLLTILGYSLYDTVVVFDKVRENTRSISTSTRRTYAEAANLAINQTLVRSINTSLAALLPVGAILYVGTFQLGSGPLKDLALALFVGMAAGTYSSIFIATPLLAQLKMLDPAMVAQAKKVANRRAHQAREEAAQPAVGAPAPTAGRPVPGGAAARAAARRTAAKRTTAAGPVGATAIAGGPEPATGPGVESVGVAEAAVESRPGTAPTVVASRPAGSTAAPPSESAPTPDDGGSAAQPGGPAADEASRPPAGRAMSTSAAKRAQPQRKPRSKRGKR